MKCVIQTGDVLCRVTLLAFLVLVYPIGAAQAQDVGLKVYIAGEATPYLVYGGDHIPSSLEEASDIKNFPDKFGYQFLGSSSGTDEFYGSFAYYLVKPGSFSPVQIDTFQLIDTRQFWQGQTTSGLSWFTSNFFDSPCDEFPWIGSYPLNCQGIPDGSYSCLYAFSLLPGKDWYPPNVRVLLTFDDGPDGDEDFSDNSTLQILNKLKNNSIQPGIKAVFFTLTHGPQWGGSTRGVTLLQQEKSEGHVVAIHAGGIGCPKKWHAINALHPDRVCCPAYPVGKKGIPQAAGTPMGRSALESDMVAGIRRLKNLFGKDYNPQFVRPPTYIHNEDCFGAYNSDIVKKELAGSEGLKLALTDVTGDYGGPWVWPWIKGKVRDETQIALNNGITDIVVTWHDSNNTTADILEKLISTIRNVVENNGYTCKFVDSEAEARDILKRRSDLGNWSNPRASEMKVPARCAGPECGYPHSISGGSMCPCE
jgi:peptidoglycan/xylan/chitin deacetylase (PgdA/CDA1 family)